MYHMPRNGYQQHWYTKLQHHPDEDLIDILTDESWLTLDKVGEIPASEDIFPVHHEDFKDFLY